MFSPPFYYMPMPVNKDGNGPSDKADTVRIVHEVWNADCATICTCTDEPTARWVAAALATRPLVAPQQDGGEEG